MSDHVYTTKDLARRIQEGPFPGRAPSLAGAASTLFFNGLEADEPFLRAAREGLLGAAVFVAQVQAFQAATFLGECDDIGGVDRVVGTALELSNWQVAEERLGEAVDTFLARLRAEHDSADGAAPAAES